MTKYCKCEWDGLCSTKLMGWTMVDEMNEVGYQRDKMLRVDFGMWTQQR